ncbi:MAG TPA: site-specific integrase, partial [Gemmatimonadales bacterium]|nr:site-specific integrase [Gemmatimonadales bacterium]
ADVRAWVTQLQALPSPRGGTLTGSTLRQHLYALSNLYRRAQGEGYVPPGFNPVSALMEKPTAEREEARWLEVHEAALLLEAARVLPLRRPDLAAAFMYPLVATFLLTGGRKAEVLGLQVADVSFDRKTVTFRKNATRRLKTRPSHRTIPLWPQLEEILRPYVFQADRPPSELLFPRIEAGQERMVTDFRKALNRVTVPAGWGEGAITPKMFRHTYCAARLQTLDRGAPVSPYTVSREMGHGSQDMVERVYSHLGQVRHRSEVVEYRIEQHGEVLAERLERLRAPFVTTFVTTPAKLG